jgi:hypothetical protein
MRARASERAGCLLDVILGFALEVGVYTKKFGDWFLLACRPEIGASSPVLDCRTSVLGHSLI